MRRVILLLLMFFMSHTAMAVTLKVALNYRQSSNRIAINKVLKLPANQHDWLILSAAARNNTSLLLLGRLEKADAEQVTMRFVLMNMEKPDIIFEPKIIMNYQQKAHIDVQRGKRSLQLTVLASKK